jgi:hypothetical protein
MLGIPLRITKTEANSRNSVPKHLTTFEVRTKRFVKLFWLFLKANLFCVFSFHSKLRNRLFHGPRLAQNEHFLPRNYGNCFESILRIFFENSIANPS